MLRSRSVVIYILAASRAPEGRRGWITSDAQHSPSNPMGVGGGMRAVVGMMRASSTGEELRLDGKELLIQFKP